MIKLYIILIVLNVANMSLFAIDNDSIPKSKINEFRILIKKVMKENNIEGTSVALFTNNNILWSESFGFIDSKRKQLVNDHTIFSIQSISKSLTATAVLIAVQDGLVDLDKPILEYLPDFKVNSCFEQNPEKKITIRLLLSHASGLAHEAPVGNNFDASFKSYEQHYKSISETWLKFPVGSDYAYSNLGYDLVALIIEKVSGMSFSQYMKIKLFEPLGMTTAIIDAKEINGNDNRATGNDVNFERVPIISPLIGSGGVYVSALDLAKFVQFHLNKGKSQGKQILNKNILIEMYKPIINNPHNYALGLFEFKFNNTFSIRHSGGGFGFCASMLWFPEYNFGSIILTNILSDVYNVNLNICSDIINNGLLKRDTASLLINPIPYFTRLVNKKKGSRICLNCDSIYKSDWDKYLGTYEAQFGGGWKCKKPHELYKFTVYKNNNSIFFNDSKLREYKQGLFFTSDGEAIDFRSDKKTFRNIKLIKAANTSYKNWGFVGYSKVCSFHQVLVVVGYPLK